MLDILLGLFTFVLVLICAFMILVILMQKPSSNAGMGAALGGGAAESAFGGQTGNVLTRATIASIVGFFVLSFLLYLGYMSRVDENEGPTYQVETDTKSSADPATAEESSGQSGNASSPEKSDANQESQNRGLTRDLGKDSAQSSSEQSTPEESKKGEPTSDSSKQKPKK